MLAASLTVASAKFVIPRIPNSVVPRPALIEHLNTCTTVPLTVVTAPAGAGKTSLLAEWARQRSSSEMAWLSCDAGDVDPERFWRSVVSVVRQRWPDAGVEAAELLDAGERSDLAIALANDLLSLSQPCFIVIDDFHLARPDAGAFGAFVRNLPSGVRVVLGSRADPAFPLARMRVQGLLCEIRERDLQLDPFETAALLGAMGAVLDADMVAEVHRLTEGWAAGVHLVGLALRDGEQPATLVEALTQTDQALSDFLVNEVLDQQPAEMVDFLLDTSMLTSFGVGLAEAVTGSSQAGDLLEQARRSHLFIVDLGGTRGRYRYHHLFGQFLQARLRARSPERGREVLLAAAAESRRRGEVVEAVDYLMRADHVAGAVQLLKFETVGALTLTDGMKVADATRALLRQYGAMDVRQAAGVIIDALILLDIGGASSITPRWLQRLEAARDTFNEVTKAHLHLAWATHLTQVGDPARSLAHLRQLDEIHQREAIESEWHSLIVIGTVQNCLWLGDFDGARAATEAEAVRPGAHSPAESALLDGYLALIDFREGDLEHAREHAATSIEAADALALPDNHNSRVEAYAVAGLCASEAGDHDEAVAYIERALLIVESTRRAPNDRLLRTVLLRLILARGTDPIAWSWLEQGRSLFAPEVSDVVRQHFDRVEVRFRIEQGDLEEAEHLLNRLTPSMTVLLLAAQLAIARDDAPLARQHLGGVDGPNATLRTRVTAGLLRALALDASNHPAALEELERVLPLAQRAGFHQSIVELGPPMWRLVRAVPSAHLAPYIETLLASADHHLSVRPGVPDRTSARDRGPLLVESLSDREITILRYLTSRLTSAEIASELYLSVNTVKTHVRAVYRKLGTNSRADAVTRGRALGLL